MTYGFVPVMLAVRDGKGSVEGLSQVTFTDNPESLTLETDPLEPLQFEYCGYGYYKNCSGVFAIDADYTFPFLNYSPHVGNICWDCVLMRAEHAADFASLLMRKYRFTVTSWRDSLRGAVNDKEIKTADLLPLTIV